MLDPAATTSAAPDGILHLPSVDDRERDELLDHLLAMTDRLPEASIMVSAEEADRLTLEPIGHMEAFVLAVPLVETLLDGDPNGVTAPMHAQLTFMALLPMLPESIVTQIAFGRGAGVESIREMVRLLARAQHRRQTVDEYVADLSAADAIPKGKLFRLFRGESRRRPSADRIDRGIALLRRTAALAPEPFRPPLLCALAWLHWARGRRAVAMAYLREASRIEPDHLLAYGLAMHFASSMPTWLDRR